MKIAGTFTRNTYDEYGHVISSISSLEITVDGDQDDEDIYNKLFECLVDAAPVHASTLTNRLAGPLLAYSIHRSHIRTSNGKSLWEWTAKLRSKSTVYKDGREVSGSFEIEL